MPSGLVETEFACWGYTCFVELSNKTAELWRFHKFRPQFEEFHEIEEGLGGGLFEPAPGDRLGYKIRHVGVDLRH